MKDNDGCFVYFWAFLFCAFLLLTTVHLLATYGAPDWLEYYFLKWGVIGE
jgi:hypothetical protein